MTDFDYGLADPPSASSPTKVIAFAYGFGRRMTGITDRMIAAASRTCRRRGEDRAGRFFCGSDGAKQCDLSLDQLRAWKGLVRVRFEYKETADAILSWAKENGIVLVDDREKGFPVASPVYPKAARHRQHREGNTALATGRCCPPLPMVPLPRPVPASPPRQPKPANRQRLVTQNGTAAAPTAERW